MGGGGGGSLPERERRGGGEGGRGFLDLNVPSNHQPHRVTERERERERERESVCARVPIATARTAKRTGMSSRPPNFLHSFITSRCMQYVLFVC